MYENIRKAIAEHEAETLEKFANTPGKITAELKSFAEMEI